MGRSPRADEAGGIYHALNRGNARHPIFFKEADYEAFERIIAEGLSQFAVDLIAYQWMNNHWHMVLLPNEDGGMGRFLRWVTLTHTQRYHAHHQTNTKRTQNEHKTNTKRTQNEHKTGTGPIVFGTAVALGLNHDREHGCALD